jgi:peptidoglycan-N-acetylglucosamine deacetylase
MNPELFRRVIGITVLALAGSVLAGCFLKENLPDQPWKGKKCAVVLTYDDALNIHLDEVIPDLDAAGLKGTFYLITSSPVFTTRQSEWAKAAREGHELGNHSMLHPCDGRLPGRGFVTPQTDLSRYTVKRAADEILAANEALSKADGKQLRTFAYPCGDFKVNDTLFYPRVARHFAGARGVTGTFLPEERIDLDDVPAHMINGSSAAEMISLVEKGMETGAPVVFLFHGVGGGHPLNVDREEHRKLLAYLNAHRSEVWVATMVDVAKKISRK